MIDVGEITVNIPNENFVYNAMAQNLRITVDYSIKDLTFLVYEDEQEILSRKYTINSLLIPSNEAPKEEVNAE